MMKKEMVVMLLVQFLTVFFMFSSLSAVEASKICDNTAPLRRMGMDCKEVRDKGLCSKSSFGSCMKECGECIDASDRIAIASLKNSVFHCGLVTRDILNEENLASALANVRKAANQVDALSALLQSEAFVTNVQKLNMPCVVNTLGFERFLSTILEDIEDLKMPANETRAMLTDFYKQGCNTEQLNNFIFSFYKESSGLSPGHYSDDKEFLGRVYGLKINYRGDEVGYTEETSDAPALSVCFQQNLKTLLKVRECQERKCYRNQRGFDPLPPAIKLSFGP